MLDYINVKYWELAHTSDELGTHKNSDYNCRCDVCGDSHKNKNTKRLHLYRKNTYDSDSIKCFNCEYTGNMYSYLRDHHPSLFNAYKQEIGANKLSSLINSNSIEIREVKKNNVLKTFDKPEQFINIKDSVIGTKYIAHRGFRNLECYYSTGAVTLGDKKVDLTDYIVIPLLENGKWFGFYSRNVFKKVFHTYLPDENTGYKIWNWFNINKLDTVYIFEAIFNSLSAGFDNSIAVLGSSLDEERLAELKKPIFCFDNDSTGREKATKYAKLGYKVVVLPSEIQDDYNDLYRKGMSQEEIQELIKANIVYGLKARVLLKIS